MKKNQKLKIGIIGSSGKMGKKIISACSRNSEFKNFKVTCLVNKKNINSDFIDVIPRASRPDVFIDFSLPNATLASINIIKKYKTPLLICTTGFNQKQLNNISKKLAKNLKWAMVSNTSLGIFLFKKIIETISPYASFFNPQIKEWHHIHKKDKPSGTAKTLAETFELNSNKKIATESFRKGEIFGKHTFILDSKREKISINHTAKDRAIFAEGSLRLAKKLLNKKTKRQYSLDDLF